MAKKLTIVEKYEKIMEKAKGILSAEDLEFLKESDLVIRSEVKGKAYFTKA